jgi:argininosuccinate lyase
VHTSRLATDIVDFASSEFGFVRLGDDVSFGSSMMPQKRNPDVFELVRGKAGGAIGDLVALLTTLKGLPGGYNRDLQDDRGPILAAGPRVLAVISALATSLPRIAFDAARCKAAVDESASQATDLAEALVRKGLPFRTAYQAVGALVHLCSESKKSLAEVTLAEAQAIDASFDAEVLLAANASGSIARKVSAGGTGEASVTAQLVMLRGTAKEACVAAAAMPSLEDLARRLSGVAQPTEKTR